MLSLRDIRRLLPRQESVYAAEAEEGVRLFAERWHIKPRHFDDYNSMSRFLYSKAVSAKRLEATCAIHSVFFFVDDLFFDTNQFSSSDFSIEPSIGKDLKLITQFLADLMQIFKTRKLPPGASLIQQSFCELGDAVAQLSPEDWFAFFADGIQDYITAVIAREVDLRQQRTLVHDLESFLELRTRDTGGLHTCQLIEFSKNAFLPTEIRNDGHIQNLTWLAISMASFVNDIFSYHKDVVVEGSEFNLIKILMDTQGLGFWEAVHKSVILVNSYADSFVEARTKLPSWGEEQDNVVGQYVDGLAEMMAGNVYWHESTNRYRSPDSPFEELRRLS